MNEIQPANKLTFAFGILLFSMYLPQIFISGMEIMTIIGLCLGTYNIWKHGFVNDTSSWKIKPIVFLIPMALFILFYVFVVIPKVKQ